MRVSETLATSQRQMDVAHLRQHVRVSTCEFREEGPWYSLPKAEKICLKTPPTCEVLWWVLRKNECMNEEWKDWTGVVHCPSNHGSSRKGVNIEEREVLAD